MIVLRLQIQGRRHEVTLPKARSSIGSAADADLSRSDVGWVAEEAELIHRGTEVELRRFRGAGGLRLRVGDEVRLGHARLALIGLLPLPEAEREADAPAQPPLPLFGDYDEGLPGATARFQLDEETPPVPASAGSASPSGSPPPPLPAVARAQPPPHPPTAAHPAQARPRGREPQPGPPRVEGQPSRRPAGAPSASSAPPPAGRDARARTPAGPKGQPPLPRPSAPAFRAPDFGEELVRQLKRAPFFALSLGLHVLVFLVLALLQSRDPAGAEQDGRGTLHAALMKPAEEQAVTDEVAVDETEIPLPLLEEIPEPKLPDDVPAETPPEDGDTLDALPDDAAAPIPVGLNPSITSVRSDTGRKQKRITPGELSQSFQKGEATTTNEKAADYVRGDLGLGTAGRRGNPLESLTREDILVVDGTFDKVGRVLSALRLPYVTVPPRAVAADKAPPMSQHKVVFWNCGESLPPEQLAVAARRLRQFVRDGGYLFTTDWAVANVLMLAFPGYLATNGPRAPLPETVVGIQPAASARDHALLRGVFPRGVEGRWWLEQASFDVRVLKPADVTTLIVSSDLEKIFSRSPVVAATFGYGRGRVLHVMGHYYQEAGNLAGTISAQRLALNFVLMRLERD